MKPNILLSHTVFSFSSSAATFHVQIFPNNRHNWLRRFSNSVRSCTTASSENTATFHPKKFRQGIPTHGDVIFHCACICKPLANVLYIRDRRGSSQRKASFACQFAIPSSPNSFTASARNGGSLIVITRSEWNISLFLSFAFARARAAPDDNRGNSRGKMIFRREHRALREVSIAVDLI